MSFLKQHIITIGLGTTVLFGAGAVATDIALQPAPITVDQPQALNWTRPTTDAQWADDVKAEQIDLRSTSVLNAMLVSQTDKLQEEQTANKRYVDCPECIYYDYYQQFLQSMDDATAQTEAHRAATTDIAQRSWEIQKIKQSIERITHELDLRNRGIVITDKLPTGAKTPTATLQRVPTNMRRHIID